MNGLLKSAAKKLPFAKDIVDSIRGPSPVNAKISSAAHNAIVLSSGGIDLPPIEMRDKVRKSAILAEDFLLEGRQVFDAIQSCLEKNGISFDSDSRIYEFGCGCGRVARYFVDLPLADYAGSDVDEEMIEWSNAHLSAESIGQGSLRFVANPYLPPVPLADGAFNLAYSISVFTHMDGPAQLQWFAEVHRLLQPGGHLLISFLEDSESELPEGVRVVPRPDQELTRSWLGRSSAPEIYCDTHNTVTYLVKQLSQSFEMIDHQPRAIRNKQSLLLLRRK